MYSTLFDTCYDEPNPYGFISNDTHYSVLSFIQWRDQLNEVMTSPARMQCIAVIWDKDYDTRVIVVLETALLHNLLAPVLMVAESRGNLMVVVNDLFKITDDYQTKWCVLLESLIGVMNDHWGVRVVTLHNQDIVISDKPPEVKRVYLDNICNLWDLR